MEDQRIVTAARPENCTFCRACQLICSALHAGCFHPSLARIRIEPGPEEMAVSFAADCLRCGNCARYCLYGVLQAVQE